MYHIGIGRDRLKNKQVHLCHIANDYKEKLMQGFILPPFKGTIFLSSPKTDRLEQP